MDANMQLMRTTAVFLVSCFALATAGTSGVVDQFYIKNMTTTMVQNVNQTTVDMGATVVFRCQVRYNVSADRRPASHIRKWFENYQAVLSTWDELDANVFPDQQAIRYSVVPIDSAPNGLDIYEFTITNAQAEDSGNYTCYTSSSMSNVSLIVREEPSDIALYINDELLPRSWPGSVNKKTLVIGSRYTLKCISYGANPYPAVKITSKFEEFRSETTKNMTVRTTVPFPGTLNRSTEVTTAFWTMDQKYLGTPITCSAGVNLTNATSTNFVPIADNASPQFICADTVTYDSMAYDKLLIPCLLYGTNLTAAYVDWRNSTGSYRVQGNLKSAAESQSGNDTRFSLGILMPSPNEVTYKMTLAIDHAGTVGELYTTKFDFVATNSKGQASHVVTVKAAGTPIGPTGDATRSASVSEISCLLALMLSAIAFIRP